jgi:hypothetical protein
MNKYINILRYTGNTAAFGGQPQVRSYKMFRSRIG